MFPVRFFPNAFFAPRFWPKVGLTPSPSNIGRFGVAAFQINLPGAEAVQTRTITGAEVVQTVQSGAETVQTF